MQLLVTAATSILFLAVQPVGDFVRGTPALVWGSMILAFGFIIALTCFPSIARRHPTNLICLACITVFMSIFVGAISALYNTRAVVIAFLITLAVVVGLTLFTMVAKVDFSFLSGFLVAGIIVVLMVGFLTMLFPSSFGSILYAGLAVILFSLFLLYDTSMILGGKHRRCQYGLDDYVFAALSLVSAPPAARSCAEWSDDSRRSHAQYMDIINIFLIILSIVGGGQRQQ